MVLCPTWGHYVWFHICRRCPGDNVQVILRCPTQNSINHCIKRQNLQIGLEKERYDHTFRAIVGVKVATQMIIQILGAGRFPCQDFLLACVF